MKDVVKSILLFLVLLFASEFSSAQTSKPVIGVVFRKGTSVRVYNATVYNFKKNISVSTDHFGLFTIMASVGDTLLVEAEGYMAEKLVVRSFKDILIHLSGTTLLAEVVVKAVTPKQNLKEVEEEFRKKGIYYKGKPPLRLLLPFGGSPLTFFHELLSKDGKRARHFTKYAQQEMDYYDVASKFNDNSIKKIVPIKDDELEGFKTKYWPKADVVRSWNDFDLYNYIKKSFMEFKEGKE